LALPTHRSAADALYAQANHDKVGTLLGMAAMLPGAGPEVRAASNEIRSTINGAYAGAAENIGSAVNAAADAQRATGAASFRYDDRVRQRALEDPVSHNFPYSYELRAPSPPKLSLDESGRRDHRLSRTQPPQLVAPIVVADFYR
jgi:hypothetical protein